MAGFEVIIYGRFWVIAEASYQNEINHSTPVCFGCVAY